MSKRKVQENVATPVTPKKRSRRIESTSVTTYESNREVIESPNKRRCGKAVKNIVLDSEIETPRATRINGRNASRTVKDASLKENVAFGSLNASGVEADELNIGPGVRNLEQDLSDPLKTPRKKRGRKKVIADACDIEIPQSHEVDIRREANPSSEPRSQSKHPVQDESTAMKDTVLSLPTFLPSHLHNYLEIQKLGVLNAINSQPFLGVEYADKNKESSVNAATLRHLCDLLSGSIERGEGNSCLVIGPAGSGKTRLTNMALERFQDEYQPIIVHLDGQVQYSDRLAMREISRQVMQQTGNRRFGSLDLEDDENPFDDHPMENISPALPPSHLPSLIANLPALSRPVVVILDSFNIFTEQPRQALLYCLFDTVQACRAGTGQHGLAVIGLTSRVDIVNLLEKRVKSRFSHRMFRTASMRDVDEWIDIIQRYLCDPMETRGLSDEWLTLWRYSVEVFLDNRHVREALRDMFCVSRDIRGLLRIITSAVVRLNPSSPFLTLNILQDGSKSQRATPKFSQLMKLKYPSLALLVASQHARTAGHDSFTFEMLYDSFVVQVRTSSAAPVMLGGGGIGMVNIGRHVMMGAFEELVRMDIFSQVSTATVGLSKEFVRYRSTVEREDVKLLVEKIGQTNLKKWFGKAQ